MKNIKSKLIAAILATTFMYGVALPVYATPLTDQQQQELNTVKSEYETILFKMADIETKIAGISDVITDITLKIEDNDASIKDLDEKINLKNLEIQDTIVKLLAKEDEYGERLRAMYKQGNNSMIATILSSESIADLVSRADAIIKIAKIDQQILEEIQSIKDTLSAQKLELDKAMGKIKDLKAENQKNLIVSEEKKTEALSLLKDYEAEEKKVLSNLAMAELYFIGDNDKLIDDINSTDGVIQGAINNLRSVRNLIVTDTTDAKVVALIEQGKAILSQRATARKAAAEVVRLAEVAARKAEAARQAAINSQSSKGNSSSTSTVKPVEQTQASSASGQGILNYAYQLLGTPYVWGGSSPRGFDCSGFTSYVFRHFGSSLPRTSRDQASVGKKVSYGDLQAGDLVFFGSGSISHVGIYIGGGNMVHSPRPGKSVEVTTMKYHKFITARRILN